MAEQASLTFSWLVIAAGTAALAQPGRIEINQVSPSTERRQVAQAKEQIEEPAALQVEPKLDRTLLVPPRSDLALDQQPLQQVASGAASAEPAPALSSTAQSRPGPRTAIEGQDRCDPSTRVRLSSAACAAVIETRSAEFDRTPAALSPEQRLLLEQRSTAPTNQQGTARRLATGEGTLEDQAVASIALRQPPPSGKKEEEKAAVSQEQAAAIVGAILNPPRN